MAKAGIKTSGISTETPKRIMLGAGTVYKNLTFGSSWEGEILGATSGGNKLEIKEEVKDIELDGAIVKVEGLTVKTGETATLEMNLAEVTPENIKMLTHGKDGEDMAKTGFVEIVSKPNIAAGDYVKNLGFVGKTLEGKDIVIIFDNALCTSGFSLEAKDDDNSTLPATFECYASLEATDFKSLPWHIFYPTPVL